jgi:hypothetical protein
MKLYKNISIFFLSLLISVGPLCFINLSAIASQESIKNKSNQNTDNQKSKTSCIKGESAISC